MIFEQGRIFLARQPLIPAVFLCLLTGFSSAKAEEATPDTPPVPSGEVSNQETTDKLPTVPPLVPDPSRSNPMDSLDDKKIIAVGNLLEFRVLEDLDEEPDPKSKNEANKSDQRPLNLLQVSDSGEVEHPYFGRLLAKGKTHRQLAMEIKQILEKDLYYQATVLISLATSGKSRGKVYISGAVNKPGPFEIPVDENMTASKALSSVGIVEDRANITQVKLVRKAPEGAPAPDPVIINLYDIRQGKTESDRVLEPEDQLIVPTVSSRGQVSIAGSVKTPGTYPIPLDRNITVKDVIVQAGLGDFADKRHVKLFRKGEKGEPMVVDMVKILETGEEEMNPELGDGDHIFVPKRLINF